MAKKEVNLNNEVTAFLDKLNHPLRKEIEMLRTNILSAASGLTENIKWNGPNYCFDNNDRITMKIQPPKQIQVIFHRGAKVQEQPKDKLVKDAFGLLTWRGNDRAIATFKNKADIENKRVELRNAVKDWIDATS